MSLFLLCMVFFSMSLLPVRVSSGISYSSCSFLIPALHMLFPFVIVWIRLGLSLVSTLFACIIFFFLTIISIGRNPVSASRMAVGVWSGSCRIVFIALLNIASICAISLIFGSHDSDPYVIIGVIMVSTSSHMALIFIPLNSLFPVSARISCVDACIFPFMTFIWSSRSPLLFIMSPRYL